MLEEKEKILSDFVRSSEPLSDDKLSFILNYKGETQAIDFKIAFESSETREWLSITKDIIAFSNTTGGYIVFGIRDTTFEKVGIAERDWHVLVDPDNIQKRINTYVLPPFTHLTSSHVSDEGKEFIILHIPESKGKTHIVVKEGKFINKHTKEEIIVLRKGEIYVRRSGSCVLIEPDDLDAILERRISHYKESLLENISQIVQAPAESKMYIVPIDERVPDGVDKVRLSSDEDAIPIKGISSTEIPKTYEQEIATSIALFKKDKSHLPQKEWMLRLYSERRHIELHSDYYKAIALISLYLDVPCFYWLQYLPAEDIKGIVNEICESGTHYSQCKALRIAACLSKSFFEKCYHKIDDHRCKYQLDKYQSGGKAGLFFKYGLDRIPPDDLEREATNIAKSLSEKRDASSEDRLWSIDFILYEANISKKKL